MGPDSEEARDAEASCEPHSHAHDLPIARARARTLDPEVLDAAARFFRAAGDPARLRILLELRAGELCVSELAAQSADELSTVSQRLRVLHVEGLLRKRRDGKHILYRLADGHVQALVESAVSHAEELARDRRGR
jgi:DNA-binding transcriptional ArsR family regulator